MRMKKMGVWLLRLVVLAWLLITVSAAWPADSVEMTVDQRTGWQRLSYGGPSNLVYTLQGSEDLVRWTNIASLQIPAVTFADPLSTNLSHRFYRFRMANRFATNDWKNQISVPEETFSQGQSNTPFGSPQPRWVKFLILRNDPTRVYFQDSTKFAFHYDFARQRIEPFQGMDRALFDQQTLYVSNQVAVLGAVIFPPGTNSNEAAVEFVGQDRYPIEQVTSWFDLVRASLAGAQKVFYFPAHSQAGLSPTDLEQLRRHGIEISSISRWLPGNHAYSSGWALGRLKYFPPNQIAEAYRLGQLLPTDILLTDGVPAEIPVLAGVITFSPSTPNSHVAILSQSFEIPFAYISKLEDQAWVRSLNNHEIGFNAFSSGWTIGGTISAEVEIIDLEGRLSPETKLKIQSMKKLDPAQITSKKKFGGYWTNLASIKTGDIGHFGGKASNFPLLRKSIPNNSPDGIALSFDLWDDFMALTNAGGGQSLRQQIESRLNPFVYPPDVQALASNLDAVRRLIRGASFSAAQKQVITNALKTFDPRRKIRFRSSTNVEDSEQLTSAGLYDSYSGCLLDDLDLDGSGPSHCDPLTEPDERGVFRAIQRVYSSFYNDNAFIERLRHQISETNVGMAVLVHYSFPDEDELANGVAALEYQKNPERIYVNGRLVTQKGAVSISNPDGSASPEVITFFDSYVPNNFSNRSFTELTFQQPSSLVPLGDTVLQWQQEYHGFLNLFGGVAKAFMTAYPAKDHFILDFEYKKDRDGLVVKQVRQIPLPKEKPLSYYVLPSPQEFRIFQGEFGDVFGNHRLKTLIRFEVVPTALQSNNLEQTFYTNISMQWLENSTIKSYNGPMALLPGFRHELRDSAVAETWSASSNLTFSLETAWQYFSQPRSPLQPLDRLNLTLTGTHRTPVWTRHWDDTFITTTNESARLAPATVRDSESIFRTVAVTDKGIEVIARFYWPAPPKGVSAGYTAPVQEWDQTVIKGLTTEPIVLKGYFSQTYRPEHHNFAENFIFEPRLEPGISGNTLEELQKLNIAAINVRYGFFQDGIAFIGLDGKIREKK